MNFRSLAAAIGMIAGSLIVVQTLATIMEANARHQRFASTYAAPVTLPTKTASAQP
jgi:hypothetical protein